jgi:RHS repeat-associated protein
VYKYKYNGKELQDELGLNMYDYGARNYMADLGRWGNIDPKAEEYFYVSPFTYVLNRPTVAIDPDGRRVYFIGGAGNDADGWDYIKRWGQAFSNLGVNFTRVNASHGKNGDVSFTNSYRHSGYEQVTRATNTDYYVGGLAPAPVEYTNETRPVSNSMIDATVNLYKQQLKDNPLAEGEQFNLAGYSYGSVLQAQAALKLADGGQVIDNLVLIGSPISDKSDLWKQLSSNKNIKNVIRYDISGDLLSNPQDVYDFIKGGIKALWEGDDNAHFDAARPGAEANTLIQTIVQWLKDQGVKN